MCVSPFSLLPSVAFTGCTVVFLEIGLSECVFERVCFFFLVFVYSLLYCI